MAIRVIVLLDSGGLGKKVKHLGSLTIANDGTGSKTKRNYNIGQHAASGPETEPKVVKRARIEGWPSQSVSIWKLVRRALEELGHGA